MTSKHAIRLPALRWYSCAVVNSSAAEEVFWATEVMFDSMLSASEPGFLYCARLLLSIGVKSTDRTGIPDLESVFRLAVEVNSFTHNPF